MSSELASLIETSTRIDGAFPTPIPGLHLCISLAIRHLHSRVRGCSVQLSPSSPREPSRSCWVTRLSPTTASKAKPFLGMRLDLNVRQIPSLRTSGKMQRARKPDRGVFVSRMTPELLDAVLRLLRLLGKPEDTAVLVLLLHREILYRLWRGEQGEQLKRMAQSDGNASVVAKAVIWLKENFDKPFSIKLIAQERT
jgi:hypothetical protein